MNGYAVRRLGRAAISAIGLWLALALCVAVGAGGARGTWLDRLNPAIALGDGAAWSAIGAAAIPTALLAGCAALVALPAGWIGGLLLAGLGPVIERYGVAGARRRVYPLRALGHAAAGAVQACQGLPAFWLGGLLVAVFSVGLGWLPPGGIVSFNLPAFGDPAYGLALQAHPAAILGDLLAHLALPALTLALLALATPLRLLRSLVPLDLRAPHARVARGMGLCRRRLLWRAARLAVPAVAGAVAAELPILVGSLVLVEYLFGWPGLALLAYHAARAGDWALLQALALLAGLVSIGAGLVADVLAAWADPRLRGHRDAP